MVEDNADLAYGLRNNLEIEGYEVDVAIDGEEGLRRARDPSETAPDLVLLDLMLPKLDGFRVLRELRVGRRRHPGPGAHGARRGSRCRTGLASGADDYVTKPFGLLELLARVEALLRRASPATRLTSFAYSASATSRSTWRRAPPPAAAKRFR